MSKNSQTKFQVSSFNFRTSTRSAEETHLLGKRIGENIQAGTVLALYGDLGSGKTVLVKGLGAGLHVPEDYIITSPTYTLINEYPGRIRLLHVDLYRIDHAGEIEDTGLDDIFGHDVVAAVEWADRLGDDLPRNHIKIQIEIDGMDSRIVKFSSYGQRGVNLLKIIEKVHAFFRDPLIDNSV